MYVAMTNPVPNMTFLDLFRRSPKFLDVLKEYFASISTGKKDSTLDKYMYFYNAIERFLVSINKSDLKCHEIRMPLCEKLRAFLLAEKHRTQEHVSRHLEHCKAAIDYAVMMEYVKFNPVARIKHIREKVEEPVSLSQDEINKLMGLHFTTKNRKLSLNLFLFQCFTGLSYIDLWLFEVEHDRIGTRNVSFLTCKTGRGKNNKPYSVELNRFAKDILKEYDGKFPTITNQSYNREIKFIAFSANIQKSLSSHNARKTYATLRYKQGMSLEGLADEMGNTPDILRKHYITKSRDRVKRDILMLKGSILT